MTYRIIFVFAMVLAMQFSFTVQPLPASDWTADPDCLLALTFDQSRGDMLDLCGQFNGDMTEDPPKRVKGKFFGAVDFTGDIIGLGDVDVLDGRDNFTISIWLKTSRDGSKSESDIWRKSNAYSFQESADRQRYILFTPRRTDHDVADDEYPADYYIAEDNEWHMYTLTYDGKKRIAYRDCKPVGKPLKDLGVVNNSEDRLVLGKKPPEEKGPSTSYRGLMDDFIIIGRAIDGPACKDLMVNGIDGSAGLLKEVIKAHNVKFQNIKTGGL